MYRLSRFTVIGSAALGLFVGAAPQAQLPSERAAVSAILDAHLPGFRLAEPGDFVQELHEATWVDSATQSAIKADFDRDGRDDWAVLAVDDSRSEYRIYYALAEEPGFRLQLLFSRTADGSASGGHVRNAIFLKETGDPGIAGRSYATIAGNPLASENQTRAFGRERAARTEEYMSVPALEVWTGPARVDTEDLGSWPDSGIAHCSET